MLWIPRLFNSDQTFNFSNLLRPSIIFVVIVILLLLNARIVKQLKFNQSRNNIIRVTMAVLIILIGTLAFVLNLETEPETQSEILKFLAVLISAGIALSSTTVLGNLIAGVMNSSIKRFRRGDFIKIGDLQGRVIDKRIFHTEILMEDRNTVTIPNLFIATHPVKLTRQEDAIVATEVSLGYDVSRVKIEELLLEAATGAELTNPYVYIMELGDYSAVYRIHGCLKESKNFASATSKLNGKVMDLLHESGIEIVSPTFMNQRIPDKKEFIPKNYEPKEGTKEEPLPEELVYDEANQLEEIEKMKDDLQKKENERKLLKDQLKEMVDENEIRKTKSSIEQLEKKMAKVDKDLQERKRKIEGEDSP